MGTLGSLSIKEGFVRVGVFWNFPGSFSEVVSLKRPVYILSGKALSASTTGQDFAKIFSAFTALEIDDIDHFFTPAKFVSYCGLISSTFASGGKVYHGGLIPTGTSNHWLKYVFIEAAWAAIRSSYYCRAYFGRIRRRKDANVAIVALARKLSEIACRCLKEKRGCENTLIYRMHDNPVCGCPPVLLAL